MIQTYSVIYSGVSFLVPLPRISELHKYISKTLIIHMEKNHNRSSGFIC